MATPRPQSARIAGDGVGAETVNPFRAPLSPELTARMAAHDLALAFTTDTAGGWRERRADGGQVIDLRDDSVVADGLAMPHTPRIYRGRLYLLEAGSG